MTLQDYKHEFANLKVWKTKGNKAPHKAILLLAVMDMIGKGLINSPFIPLTDDLERRFKSLWDEYVHDTKGVNCAMSYPFYHMSSSSFWDLVKLPTYEARKEYTMTALRRSFRGALISEELFALLRDESSRNELREVVVRNYLTPHNESYTIDGLIDLAADSALFSAAIICSLIA